MKAQTFTSYEQAIELMRSLTDRALPFSLTFMKVNGAISRIDRAKLRGMSIHGMHAAYRIQYTNLSTNEHRSFYLPLLMAVNDIKIQLKS